MGKKFNAEIEQFLQFKQSYSTNNKLSKVNNKNNDLYEMTFLFTTKTGIEGSNQLIFKCCFT